MDEEVEPEGAGKGEFETFATFDEGVAESTDSFSNVDEFGAVGSPLGSLVSVDFPSASLFEIKSCETALGVLVSLATGSSNCFG